MWRIVNLPVKLTTAVYSGNIHNNLANGNFLHKHLLLFIDYYREYSSLTCTGVKEPYIDFCWSLICAQLHIQPRALFTYEIVRINIKEGSNVTYYLRVVCILLGSCERLVRE